MCFRRLGCQFLCANNQAVNLHLNDENTDSTMLRWRYVSSNSSGFFSCHLGILSESCSEDDKTDYALYKEVVNRIGVII